MAFVVAPFHYERKKEENLSKLNDNEATSTRIEQAAYSGLRPFVGLTWN